VRGTRTRLGEGEFLREKCLYRRMYMPPQLASKHLALPFLPTGEHRKESHTSLIFMVGEPDAAALPVQPVRQPEASVGAASAATGPLDAVGAARAPVTAFPGGPEAGGDPGSDQATGETSEAAMDVGEEAAEADEGAAAAENSLLQCGSKRARICACIWKVCRRRCSSHPFLPARRLLSCLALFPDSQRGAEISGFRRVCGSVSTTTKSRACDGFSRPSFAAAAC
jgi:hypothetical protein